ncbi:MAG: hypothetical protein RLZZ558_100 [Planctomycetota bacterium]
MKLDLNALKDVDYGQLLGWLRQRWLPLLCGLIVVASPLTAFLLLDAMHRPVQEEARKRGEQFDKLASLERASVTVRLPDGSSREESLSQGLNRAIIDKVAAYNRSLGELSGVAYAKALERNRGGHAMVAGLDAYLPIPVDPNARKVNLLRESALPLLESARDRLLQSSRAGQPPAPAAVLDQVQRAEVEYLAGTLRKRARSEVTEPREIQDLNNHLVDARKELLTQHALSLDFYLDPWAIPWPAFPSGGEGKADPSMDQVLSSLFEYQWRLWLVEDVLAAIQAVNRSGSGETSRGPMTAPLKRVLQLAVQPIRAAATEQDAQADTGMGGGEGGEGDAGPTGEAIDPKAAVSADPAASITGLVSNQLFDVRTATLRVVIETSALPAFVDQLARQNFMSVTDVSMRPADSYQAAREGYVYGIQPCSDVTLTLQSIWFREWVTERMPSSMRRTLNTAGPAPREDAGTDGESGTEGTPDQGM